MSENIAIARILIEATAAILKGDVKATMARLDKAYDAVTALQRARLVKKTRGQ